VKRRHFRSVLTFGPILVLLIVCAGEVGAAASDSTADMILHGGKILTVDDDFSTAQAVAIDEGRILAVGSDEDAMQFSGSDTREVDLGGNTVIPGLIDSHLHQLRGALNAQHVSLLEARSIEDVQAAIEERVGETSSGEWVQGSSAWHESLLEEGRLPTVSDLDPVSPDNPVFIPRGGHVATVNSAALEEAGITEETEDPEGGVIVRDDSGEPTGVLLESATALVEDLLPPPPPPEEQAELLKDYMSELNSYGITGVTDPGLNDDQISLYTDLWRNNELSVRTNMLYGNFAGTEEEAEHATSTYETGFGDAMLSFDGMKVQPDGGVEGARLSDPYEIVEGQQTDPDYYGELLLPPGGTEELQSAFSLAAEAGWQVQAHGVGDVTIDTVVDAYEEVNQETSLGPLRWTVMHIFLPTQESLEKMKDMEILSTAQDHPVLLGQNMVNYWGTDRASYAIPIRTLLDEGIMTGGGTDAPVLPANPFVSMWWMVARDTLAGETLGPEQAITREEALRLYTIDSAYTQFAEEETGSIEVGKLADLVVLSEDILTVPDENIRDIEAQMTLLDGGIVYERE
jgi:predicted amidohydrolase YtcJ